MGFSPKSAISGMWIVLFFSLLFSSCMTKGSNAPVTTADLSGNTISPLVQPWEDGLRTNPDKNEFEWWYFDFSFSDGSTAVIFFSTKSFLDPAGKPDPEVNLVITDPQGNKISVSDNPGKENFTSSTSRLDVTLGNSFAKGDLSGCQLHFEKDGTGVDLHLISKAPAWRPGTGISYYGAKKTKYFAWLAAIPYGIAEGTLHYKGKSVKVSGTGYHDHNWGNIRLDKIKTQWYWGRARINTYTLIFAQMLTAPQYGSQEIPVFYLAKGNRILSGSTYTFTFTPSQWKRHPGGRDYPEKIEINVTQPDMDVTIKISSPVIIEAQSLLDKAPWFVRVLSRPFTNPYYFRFNADFTLEYKGPSGTVNKQGKGIYEMMLLRGLQTVR